ncbi:hypothetical protein NE237_026728 [Protea cynaroides]|uniref:Uncharacterized protein n=1 Tax=Protea cynaroides TaxID=273540 RepID=A0A9Q0JR53_9MAGN|nr:hypothetical protein NE237_026728 [Protea cynaroides]
MNGITIIKESVEYQHEWYKNHKRKDKGSYNLTGGEYHSGINTRNGGDITSESDEREQRFYKPGNMKSTARGYEQYYRAW